MTDKPSSPFQGLDKALLRSTQASPSPSPAAPTAPRKPAPQRARVHARTGASTDARKNAGLVDRLYRRLDNRQHLASSTFRFQSEELGELERVFVELNALRPRKSSKNDLVRLAVNWLLEDYKQNGEHSMLAQVFARM
jgi:hypothetical protein